MTSTARHTFYLQGDDHFLAPPPAAPAAEDGGERIAAPEWVNVLPKPDKAGRIYSRDYRVVAVDDLEALAARSNAALKRQRGGGPVDADHTLYGGWFNAGGGPVLGWAEEFEARADGLYARVDWLPEGRELIESKRYRYTSSVVDGPSSWEMSSDGMPEKLRIDAQVIEGFGITNIPALETTSMFTLQGGDPMLNETFRAIARKLGLAEDASADDVRAAFKRFTAASPTPSPGTTDDAAGEDDAASEEEAAPVAAAGPQVDDEDAPDEAASAAVLRKRLAAARDALAKLEREQAEAAVDQLARDGKLTPAQRKVALSLAAKPGGLADLRALYAAAPAVIDPARPAALAAAPEDLPPSGISREAWRLTADKNLQPYEIARRIQSARAKET